MLTIILANKARFLKYTDFDALPEKWTYLFAEGMSDAEIIARGKEAVCMIADPVLPVRGSLIEGLPNLKLIQSEGVGYNQFDLKKAKEKGIYVCNNAAANSGAVAEHMLLLILALQRRLYEGERLIMEGKQADAKRQFILDGIMELEGSTVGIVGFGAIGKAFARRLTGFDVRTVYYSRHRADQTTEASYQATYCQLDRLLHISDIVCICLPVTPETEGFVDQSFLNQMKTSALLINAARGEIMDQQAVADALLNGKIKGAGIDTLSPEPFQPDNPILSLPETIREQKLVITPHIAGTTYRVFKKMHRHCWENVQKIAEHKKPEDCIVGPDCP